MSSEEKWNWCNNVFIKVSLIISPILVLINVILMILALVNTWHVWVMTIVMFSSVIYILILVPFIEIYGRKKFKNIEDNN